MALSQKQLDAMMGMSLTPDQSATALGSLNPGIQAMINAGNVAQSQKEEGGMQSGALSKVGGAIKDVAKGTVEPFARAGVNLYGAGVAATGDMQHAQDIAQKGVNVPGMGQTMPIGTQGSFAAKVGDAAGAGAEAGATIEGAKGLVNPVKAGVGAVKDYLAKRAEKKAINAVQSTAETLTKGERNAAIAEGRMEPTLTGGGKYVPSETEQNAGKIMTGKLKSNPVKNVGIMQDEIKTLGKDAETYLETNAQSITNQEHADMFAAKRAEMEKYSTPSEMKAYDEQVGLFSKQLPGRGGSNTPNYYKALKDYETNVTSRLAKGKEALLTETGSAKLQAAKDVRGVVRDMIGEKNPEFKGKMYNLASLYDALPNVIAKAEQTGGASTAVRLAKKYPKTATVLGVATAEEAIRKARDFTGI